MPDKGANLPLRPSSFRFFSLPSVHSVAQAVDAYTEPHTSSIQRKYFTYYVNADSRYSTDIVGTVS